MAQLKESCVAIEAGICNLVNFFLISPRQNEEVVIAEFQKLIPLFEGHDQVCVATHLNMPHYIDIRFDTLITFAVRSNMIDFACLLMQFGADLSARTGTYSVGGGLLASYSHGKHDATLFREGSSPDQTERRGELTKSICEQLTSVDLWMIFFKTYREKYHEENIRMICTVLVKYNVNLNVVSDGEKMMEMSLLSLLANRSKTDYGEWETVFCNAIDFLCENFDFVLNEDDLRIIANQDISDTVRNKILTQCYQGKMNAAIRAAIWNVLPMPIAEEVAPHVLDPFVQLSD